jgi:exopolyphosphatase/pppGpp-phosphohydrolase
LAPESVAIAIKSLKEEIIPFLKSQNIATSEVLVFATAAVRKSMNDPNKSGQKFLDSIVALGFKMPKVFSEDDECIHAALGVISGMQITEPELKNYSIIDTGGGSHQLIEVHNNKIIKQKSIPLGSHSDLSKLSEQANFIKLGFSKTKALVVIGTSSTILNAMDLENKDHLRRIRDEIRELEVNARREYLTRLINASKDPDKATAIGLLVDYRLMIIDKAFSLILNCADQLEIESFHYSKRQAMHFVSQNGFYSI